jgi:hypothetical protein
MDPPTAQQPTYGKAAGAPPQGPDFSSPTETGEYIPASTQTEVDRLSRPPLNDNRWRPAQSEQGGRMPSTDQAFSPQQDPSPIPQCESDQQDTSRFSSQAGTPHLGASNSSAMASSAFKLSVNGNGPATIVVAKAPRLETWTHSSFKSFIKQTQNHIEISRSTIFRDCIRTHMMSQFRVLYNAYIKEPELRFDEALGQPISDLLPQLFNIYRRAFDIEIAKSVQSLTCCPVIYEQDDFERFVSRLLEYNQQHGIGDNINDVKAMIYSLKQNNRSFWEVAYRKISVHIPEYDLNSAVIDLRNLYLRGNGQFNRARNDRFQKGEQNNSNSSRPTGNNNSSRPNNNSKQSNRSQKRNNSYKSGNNYSKAQRTSTPSSGSSTGSRSYRDSDAHSVGSNHSNHSNQSGGSHRSSGSQHSAGSHHSSGSHRSGGSQYSSGSGNQQRAGSSSHSQNGRNGLSGGSSNNSRSQGHHQSSSGGHSSKPKSVNFNERGNNSRKEA